jgi:hypothetical protein
MTILKIAKVILNPHDINRKSGLTPAGFGKRRARPAAPGSFVAPVTSLCSSPRLRSSSSLCRPAAVTRCLMSVRHLPVTGRFLLPFLPSLRYGITLWPNRG